MSNRSRSAFDPYSGAITIVRMAQSPQMRKLLVQAARTSDGTPQWCWTIQRITSIQPFSSASSSSVNTFRQATNIFASCSCSFVRIRVGRPWLAPSALQWSRWSAFVPTTSSVLIAVMVLLPTTFTITIITKMPSTRNKGVSTREETLHDNVTDNNNSERWRLSLHCFLYLPRRCPRIESSR